MAFKNKLFGYEKESVDTAVSDYQVQLQRAHDEINLLKRKLDDTKSELMQAKSDTERMALQNQRQLYELEYKLKDMTEKHQTALLELTEQRQRKDGISQLYEYAYNSAAKLSKSAYQSSRELVDNTCSHLTQTQEHTRTFLEDIKYTGQQVHNLLQNLMENVREMDQKVGLFTEKSDRLEQSASSLENMKKPIYEDFDRLMMEFESDTGRLLSEKTRREAFYDAHAKEASVSSAPVARTVSLDASEGIDMHPASRMVRSEPQDVFFYPPSQSPSPEAPATPLETKHNSMLEEQKRLLETAAPEPYVAPAPPSPTTSEPPNKRLAVKDLLKKYSQLD